MLHVRIGWIAQAMRLLLQYRKKDDDDDEHEGGIHDLSPSAIKCLMFEALDVEKHKKLTWLQQKQIAGALSKVKQK